MTRVWSRYHWHPVTLRVLQHPAMQNLRHIRQHGPTYRLIPTLGYNRFQHSIEVARQSAWAVRVLSQSAPGINLHHKNWSLDRVKLWVELAGTLHDVGHNIQSHVFDRTLAQFVADHPQHQAWVVSHEERGQRLIRHILEPEVQTGQLTPEDVGAVCDLIHPEGAAPSHVPEWVRGIVANRHHGIDIDRLTYLQWDSRAYHFFSANHKMNAAHPHYLFQQFHAGWQNVLKPHQVKNLIRHMHWSDTHQQFLFDANDVHVVRKVMQLRSFLFTHVYNHPHVLGLEFAFQQWLWKLLLQDPARFQCLSLHNDKACHAYIELIPQLIQGWNQQLVQHQWESSTHVVTGRIPRLQFYHSQFWQHRQMAITNGICIYDPLQDRNHEVHILPTMDFHQQRQSVTPYHSLPPELLRHSAYQMTSALEEDKVNFTQCALLPEIKGTFAICAPNGKEVLRIADFVLAPPDLTLQQVSSLPVV